MNERIQELTIEANKYATEQHPMPGDADAMTKEIIIGNRIGEAQQKLAELIVLECASAVNSRDDSDTGFWANIIKEHFGVEK